MSPTWGIVEYRGRDGLLRLKADWQRLLLAIPDHGPQHAYETYLAYLDALSEPEGRFTCAALTDGMQVRAICPLEAKRQTVLGRQTRVLGLPWNLHDLHRDVVCPPDEAQARLLPCLLRYLRQLPGGPSWLVLDRVLSRSAAWKCLQYLGRRAYCTDVAGESDEFDCSRPFEDLAAGFSRKFRSNLRNAHRKLETLADVRFVSAGDAPGLRREFRSFLALEASGWKDQAESGGAIRRKDELSAFFRDLARLHGDVGQCEVNALYSEGQCLAAQFCLRAGVEYAVLKIGYDEGYARMAPGQLLLEHTLTRCCAAAAVRRLTLISHTEWARVWRPDVVAVHCAYVAVGAWSARALVPLLRLRLRHGPRLRRLLRRGAV